MAIRRVRFVIYLGIAIMAGLAGAMFSGMNFAWVCMVNGTNRKPGDSPSMYEPLDWGSSEQQIIFAAGGIGTLIMALPSGWLINRFGSRLCCSVGMALQATATLLIPVATQWNYIAVVVLRVIVGMITSIFVPLAYDVLSWWAPKQEAGLAIASSSAGLQLGILAQVLVGGAECQRIGWEWIFYISGILSVIYSVLWFALYREEPEQLSFVTKEEIELIHHNRMRKINVHAKVPWRAILSNVSVWMCLICGVSQSAVTRGMNQFTPTYIRDQLKTSVTTNGYISSLPTGMLILGGAVAGPLSDIPLFHSLARMKILNAISFLGAAACALGLSFVVTSSPEWLPVLLLSLLMFTITLSVGGFVKLPMYISAEFGAVVGSLLNLSYSAGSIIMPLAIGSLTSHGTSTEWSHVFYVYIGVTVIAAAVFQLFASDKHINVHTVTPIHESEYGAIVQVDDDDVSE